MTTDSKLNGRFGSGHDSLSIEERMMLVSHLGWDDEEHHPYVNTSAEEEQEQEYQSDPVVHHPPVEEVDDVSDGPETGAGEVIEGEVGQADEDTVLEPPPDNSADDESPKKKNKKSKKQRPNHILPSWDHPQVIADEVAKKTTFIEVDGAKGSQPYRWDGPKWTPVSHRAVQKAVFAEGDRLADRAQDDFRSGKVMLNSEAEETTLPKMTRTKAENAVLSLLSRKQGVTDDHLNRWIGGTDHGPVLSVRNGLLRLTDFALMPHDPDYFGLTTIPVAHDPNATKPKRWLESLDLLLAKDADAITVVKMLFGACLDPTLSFKHFVVFHGKRDTGKSTMTTVLTALLGSANVSAKKLQHLADPSNRFAAYALRDKMANVSGDEPYFEGNAEVIKSLTGRDPVDFEGKGRDSYQAINTCRMVATCNTIPSLKDPSGVVWDRMNVVHFARVLEDHEKDLSRTDPAAWADELPGILNWAIEGLVEFRRAKVLPVSIPGHREKEQAKLGSDPRLEFLLERFEGVNGSFVSSKSILKAFQQWADDNNIDHRKYKQRGLTDLIPSVYPKVVLNDREYVAGKRERGVTNLRLKPE